MKKLLTILLMMLPMLFGCKQDDSQSQNIRTIAHEKIKDAVLNSLIDKRDAELNNVTVEFESDNVIVLSCQVTANNSLGGMARNVFEYIYTIDGKERVDNVSAGSTPYSAARALAKDSVYTKSYKPMVEKELISLMSYM